MISSSRRSAILLGLVLAFLAGGGVLGDASGEFRRPSWVSSGLCPAGWKIDPLRAACAKCPPGYSRTVLPLDSMACERGATVLQAGATPQKRGTGFLGTDCPSGQYIHWDLYCYACPPGYIRTASGIEARDACAKPVLPSYSAATWQPACPKGSFRDLGRGDCWKCPEGWIRTASPLNSDTGCASDLTGIFGVDPRAMCSSALRAIDTGGEIAAETQAAIRGLVSPLVKPLTDGINSVVRQFRTPAEFDRFINRLAAPLRAHPLWFDEFPAWADRVMSARDRLLRLMLDPAVTCDGDLARVSRELAGLDLWPRGSRAASAPSPGAFDLLRRPFALDGFANRSLQTPRDYLVIAVEANISSAYVFGWTGSFSFLFDRSGPVAWLGSTGPSLGWPQTPVGGVGLTALYFPAALPSDFLEIGSLGMQWNVGAELAKVVFDWLTGRPVMGDERGWKPGGGLAVSFDPIKVASAVVGAKLETMPVGLGLSLTFEHRVPGPKGALEWVMGRSRANAESDMTSIASNASWSPKNERTSRIKEVLKQFSLSGDWTGRIMQFR